MECKYICKASYKLRCKELIDTLWNVNFISIICYMMLLVELIDTLWNVNFFTYEYQKTSTLELIDTLWNVNRIIPREEIEKLRINRYIMECKSICFCFV